MAKCNQAEFIKSGTDGKCIETRELIIALPESFVDYDLGRLLEIFVKYFKQNYGVEREWRMKVLVKQMMKRWGVNEQLKTENQME